MGDSTAQEIRHMVEQAVPIEAIDDAFVRIMMEELSWRSPTVPPPANCSDTAAAPNAHETATKPADGTADAASVFAPTQWRIRVQEKGGAEHVLCLSETPVTIGRSRNNTVIVQCPQVSRRHVQIWVDEGWPRIVDLSGRRHMRVNGVKMPGSSLQNQDIVEIGSVKIFVDEVSRQETAPP